MARIHPTALVGPEVELADTVEIQAYCIIKGKVRIGEGTVVHESTHVEGDASIGKRCRLGPAAYIGLPPQHTKYNGEPTRLIMGDDVVVRETSVIHRAFKTGPNDATVIGDRCFLMGQSHIGHDSVVANDVILSGGAMLAGHCRIDERVFVGGGAKVHQFCRVGRLVIIAGNEGISRDVPPFAAVRYGGLKAYNAIGCRRAGLTQPAIHALRQAFYCIHHHRNRIHILEAIRRDVPQTPEVLELLEFMTSTKRGIHPSVHFRRPFQDEDC
jgi:UDP-N-acetylglucosamine acyltransferase